MNSGDTGNVNLVTSGSPVLLATEAQGSSLLTLTLNGGTGSETHIVFDKETGVITWGDVNATTGLLEYGPSSVEAGTWQIVATAHDGHGSSDAISTDIKVVPVVTSIVDQDGSGQHPVAIEDQSYSLSILPAGQLTGGVTYELWLDTSGTVLPNGAVDTTHLVPFDSFPGSWVNGVDVRQINGPEGGFMTFDPVKGTITWTPSNADVTLNSGGTQDRPEYNFGVYADSTDGTAKSAIATFKVQVENDPTNVGFQLPDGTNNPTSVSIQEDSSPLLVQNAFSNDPHSETTPVTSPYWSDSYYQLTVQEGNTTYTLVQVVDPNHPNAPENHDPNLAEWWTYSPNQAAGGGTIWFDKNTGQIVWTNGSDRPPTPGSNTGPSSLVGPTDADVGNYTFTISHNDGHGSQVPESFTVTVNDATPVITPVAHQTTTEDSTFTMTVQTNDEPSDHVSYALWVDPTPNPDGSSDGNWIKLTGTGVQSAYINGPQGGMLNFDTRYRSHNLDSHECRRNHKLQPGRFPRHHAARLHIPRNRYQSR